jgi:hypothetical protein
MNELPINPKNQSENQSENQSANQMSELSLSMQWRPRAVGQWRIFRRGGQLGASVQAASGYAGTAIQVSKAMTAPGQMR